MDGILNVLKPSGMTSFDVIGFLRKVTGQKKIGHAGTLDPSAAGVLPVCFGNATKAIEFMMEKDKVYRAELTLGSSTDTQDSSGKVIFSKEVDASDTQIAKAIMEFVGELRQVPPMYSAIKVGGKKLYELAREGEVIERQPRHIEIFNLRIIRIWDKPKKVLFDVHCSKGTYVRTLCNDIGEKLGCGGHMSFLVRTRAGKYNIDTALTLENIKDLSQNNLLSENMIPVESVFEDYEGIVLQQPELFKYNNGVWIEYKSLQEPAGHVLKVYDNTSNFIGLGEVFQNGETTYLKSKKFFK